MDPEYFDSMSVMFSAIPQFDDIIKRVHPLLVVTFLHNLYLAVDGVLAQFDVYKVETIRDSYMVFCHFDYFSPYYSGSCVFSDHKWRPRA